MAEKIGAPRVSRIHEGGLRGNGMGVLSDGNGTREVEFLGKRRGISISGNGEALGEVSEFLQSEFGVNEELAKDFAIEMCGVEE